MAQLAVRLVSLPGVDMREALGEAIDQASQLDAPVEVEIKGGTLILHPHTPLEDAEATYDKAMQEHAHRLAEAEKARAAKGKAKPAAKAVQPKPAAPKPVEAKKPT